MTVDAVGLSGRAVGPFRARAAVITLPLAVLKAGAVRFRPAPDATLRAARRLEVGQVFKIQLRFRTAFWEEDDFVRRRLGKAGAAIEPLHFVHCAEADVPVWWTSLPARAPLLTGWAGGPRAEALLDEPPPARLERSLASLSRALAVPRRVIDDLLESTATHDWRADPFSRGAYAYIAVGGVPAQRTLAAPVESTLFFAGEATDPDAIGTVGGALASGRRAAGQVLGALHA